MNWTAVFFKSFKKEATSIDFGWCVLDLMRKKVQYNLVEKIIGRMDLQIGRIG